MVMKPTPPPPRSSKQSANRSTTRAKAAAQAARKPIAKEVLPVEEVQQYSAPALEKGLDILELLTDAQHPLSMAEIAQQLGRSVSEIFRMVVTLQRRNWLYLDRADRYHLSSRMFELAHRNRPIRTLVEAALPGMQLVARQTQQSCHLTIVESGRILVIAQVDAPGMLSFGVRTGSVIGLFNTASGQVLLAFRSAEEREQLLQQHAMVTGEMGVSKKRLMAEVDKVTTDGYACSPSEQVRGVTNLGCPIWGRGKQVVAAMVIPYMEGLGVQRGPSLKEARQVLCEVAADVSKALGHQAAQNDTP
jgi:DNA-binding IclR family transcriptional regulator